MCVRVPALLLGGRAVFGWSFFLQWSVSMKVMPALHVCDSKRHCGLVGFRFVPVTQLQRSFATHLCNSTCRPYCAGFSLCICSLNSRRLACPCCRVPLSSGLLGNLLSYGVPCVWGRRLSAFLSVRPSGCLAVHLCVHSYCCVCVCVRVRALVSVALNAAAGGDTRDGRRLVGVREAPGREHASIHGDCGNGATGMRWWWWWWWW